MDTMSASLIPAECDLRDFPFTPLFRSRLFGSSFHARSTDAEWRAGVTLWLKSWDQVPAGSLPNDDVDLCRLAELGRDRKTWAKVREGAMRGWVRCDDGRLYHPVVAEGVLDAWSRRAAARRKGIAGASARWSTSNAQAMPQLSDSDGTGNATAIARAMPGDGKRQGQREGQERKKEKPVGAVCGDTTNPAPNGAAPSDPETELFRRGKHVLGKEAGGLIARLLKAKDGKIPLARAAIEMASTKQNPREYIGAIARGTGPPSEYDEGVVKVGL